MSRAYRYERRRPRWRGALWVLTLTILTAIATGLAFFTQVGKGTSVLTPGIPVTVVVTPGEGTREIARKLEDQGVIASAVDFRRAAEARGVAGSLKPGTYELTTGMPTDQLLELLVRGPDQGVPLTIPEGYTLADIRQVMTEKGGFPPEEVARALRSPELTSPYRPRGRSLEGLLFPATYYVREDTRALDIFKQMLTRLEEVMGSYDLAQAPRGLSPYQVLIVASLVEREAKVAEDRPKIATVIYNRLDRGQRLEIDATVLYALKRAGRQVPRALTTQHLQFSSPFNTYRVTGLPPEPIASPGQASIEAALNPARGNWLYYVIASKEGHHAFTADYQEFLRLKQQAKARGLL